MLPSFNWVAVWSRKRSFLSGSTRPLRLARYSPDTPKSYWKGLYMKYFNDSNQNKIKRKQIIVHCYLSLVAGMKADDTIRCPPQNVMDLRSETNPPYKERPCPHLPLSSPIQLQHNLFFSKHTLFTLLYTHIHSIVSVSFIKLFTALQLTTRFIQASNHSH